MVMDLFLWSLRKKKKGKNEFARRCVLLLMFTQHSQSTDISKHLRFYELLWKLSACSPLQGWGWQLPALQGRSSALLLCAEIPSLQEQHCVKPSQFHLECTNRRVTSHILVPPNCWGCSHLNVFSYWLRKCLPFWWTKNSGSLAVTQSCAFLNLCKLRGATDTWSAQRPHLLLRGNIPCPTDEAQSMY